MDKKIIFNRFAVVNTRIENENYTKPILSTLSPQLPRL